MAFAAGDVVFLKSGGEAMTVAEIEGDEALCLWTGDDGDLFRETIPTLALQTVQAAEEGEEEDAESEEDENEQENEEVKTKAKQDAAA